jgi:hypothetical protein
MLCAGALVVLPCAGSKVTALLEHLSNYAVGW